MVEVPVHPNTPLKEGDVLFRIDPKPYEYVVAEKQAALAEAEQNVKQLKASLDASDRPSGKGRCSTPVGATEL